MIPRPSARAIAVGALALVLAAACARMGYWQYSRWQEKRALARELAAALAAPPAPLPADARDWPAAAARRVRGSGALEPRWQLLLSDRWRGDSAGVEVLTPVRLAGGAVALVDRGWLASPDGIHARELPAPAASDTAWTALLEPLPAHVHAAAWERLRSDSVTVLSVRALAADSLASRAPYAIAPWVLRALPEPGAPPSPSRASPEPPDPFMHLSYTVQWALFALAFLAGGAFVVTRPRRGPAGGRG